jgi:hypothetical protein
MIDLLDGPPVGIMGCDLFVFDGWQIRAVWWSDMLQRYQETAAYRVHSGYAGDVRWGWHRAFCARRDPEVARWLEQGLL